MKKQTITYLFRSALLIGLIFLVSTVMPAPGERETNKKLSAASVPHPVLLVSTEMPAPGERQTYKKLSAASVPHPAGLKLPDSGSVGWGHGPSYPIPGGMIQDQTVAGSGTGTQDQPDTGCYLYSFAGVSSGSLTARSYKFDGTTWTPIADYQGGPTDYPAAVGEVVPCPSSIYIMNGATSTGPVTTVYRYDSSSNTYTQLSSNSVAVMACSVVNGNDGKLYKMGGIDASNNARNELEIYNIAGNTWSAGAPMPAAKGFMSAWREGNFIYAAGGKDNSGGTATAFRYDTVSSTWTPIASLPATRWGAASSFYIDRVLLAGGYVGGDVATNISTSVISYDAGANAWIPVCDAMPDERARMNGAVVGGSFYVIGGRSMASGNGTDTVQVGTAVGQTVLYDQTDNPAANSTVAQNFEAANDAFDNNLADDFMVPAGGWTIGEVRVIGVYFNGAGPADSFNVVFHADAGGLPGAAVAGGTYTNLPYTNGASAHIVLPTSLTLAPGHYWLEIQANMSFTPNGEFGWTDRVVTSFSPAAWQNPGGGFGTPCTTWGARGPGCMIDNGNNDQLFQLLTPPTVTVPPCTPCNPYTTTTMSGVAIVPGTTDIGNHCDDCATPVAIPFAVTLFGTNYPAGTMFNASSNGSLGIDNANAPFGDSCPLPDARLGRDLLVFQTDGYTLNSGFGIFTATTGTAPNRNFIIEWRNQYFPGNGNANYELIFHENTNCFDMVYGATDTQGSSESSGVQKSATGPVTQFSCSQATLVPGLKVTYCPNTCSVPVPTSAVSRKVHGAAGTFDINLPLVPLHDPGIGIEDRQDPATACTGSYFLTVRPTGDGTGRSFDSSTSGANAVGMPPGNNQNAFFNSNFFAANYTSTANEGQPYDFSMGIKNGSTLLWYNGDFNGVNGLANENNTSLGAGQFANVFDDFQVTGGGFHITSVFSDNLANTNITGACWEIRSGISEGNGGTLVASACTTTPIVTPTGRSGFGFTEYMVEVPVSPALNLPPLGAIGWGHQIVVHFPTPVTVDAVHLTAGTGQVASFSDCVTNTITVNLACVPNAQRIEVTLVNVCDGTNQGDVQIHMGVLYGDSGGNGTVNASDIAQIKARGGQVVGAGNFRSDINANGTINAGDIAIAKQRGGTGLPAQ